MKFKFDHGDELRDSITLFSGVVTARTDYITGCNQYTLTPKMKKGDKEPRDIWSFDEDRLEVIKLKKVKLKVVSNGADNRTPRKSK